MSQEWCAMTTANSNAKVKALSPISAEETAKQIEQTVSVGKEALETVVKASTDAASKGYEKAVALTKDQVDVAVKAQNAAFHSYEEAVAFGKDNLEAVIKAGSILSRGLQDLGKTMIGLAQESIEDSVAASRQFIGIKTLKDFIDLQTSIFKARFDRALDDGSRLSDQTVKLAEESFAPIGERVNVAVDKLVKTA
jgi:phasin family protein